MHDAVFTGHTAAEIYEGVPHPLVRMGVLDLECSPPFKLKNIDAAVRENTLAYHIAVHSRLAVPCPLGACEPTVLHAVAQDFGRYYSLLCSRTLQAAGHYFFSPPPPPHISPAIRRPLKTIQPHPTDFSQAKAPYPGISRVIGPSSVMHSRLEGHEGWRRGQTGVPV